MRWFGRGDEDYREEIATHIELETQANIDRGMAPDEARRAARVAFGGVASVRQQLHRGRRGYWRSALAQDVRYGLRMIRRNRLLSCVVVLIMGLGIGTTTAVFNAVNAVAFAPAVSNDPDSYVQFTADDDSGYQVASKQRYETLRAQARSMRQLAAWSVAFFAAPLGPTDGARVQGALVSCNLLTTLSDMAPLAGRLLHEDDCTSAAPVAVMSRDLWRTRFASDPAIVGKSFAYGGHSLTIVGVTASSALPDGFAAGLWLPYTAGAQLKDLIHDGFDQESDFPWLGMVGRLAPGYSRRAAAAEFRVLTSRESDAGPDLAVGLKLTDGSLWSMAPADTLWMFSTALAFPMLVTLIVCAAVATLLLSRAVKRQREMAIRLAVGGSRLGLVRMLNRPQSPGTVHRRVRSIRAGAEVGDETQGERVRVGPDASVGDGRTFHFTARRQKTLACPGRHRSVARSHRRLRHPCVHRSAASKRGGDSCGHGRQPRRPLRRHDSAGAPPCRVRNCRRSLFLVRRLEAL